MLKLRDRFGIKTFVETGTANGIGARFWAQRFEEVHSCDIDFESLKAARKKVHDLPNVYLHLQHSPDFLRYFRKVYGYSKREDVVFFLLDAHWYESWPLLDELKALKGFKNCCIEIHDFKVPNMGYVSYNKQDLDIDYIREDLMAVNPNFCLYSNNRENSHIYTKEEAAEVPGLVMDKETEWVFDYAWESEAKRFRGILYAVPERLPQQEFRLTPIL